VPSVLGALWSVNRLEMESVLREVCQRVLHEKGTAKPVLRQRAEGLKVLGRIFRATAKEAAQAYALQQQISAAMAAAAAAAGAAAPADAEPATAAGAASAGAEASP